MAATIADVMTALKTRLATITDLQVYDYAPDNPTPPCAFVLVPSVPSYRATMSRGKYILPFQIAVLAGAQLDRVGQHRLAAFANQTGSQSIRVAVEGDPTLGGIADDCMVDSFDRDGLEQVGLVGYYGGTFRVLVALNGT